MLAVTVIAASWQMRCDDHLVSSRDRICSDEDKLAPYVPMEDAVTIFIADSVTPSYESISTAAQRTKDTTICLCLLRLNARIHISVTLHCKGTWETHCALALEG